jgi:hypothetical protein
MSVDFFGYSDFTTNKPDRRDITEILLKVVLNTINLINCIVIDFIVNFP